MLCVWVYGVQVRGILHLSGDRASNDCAQLHKCADRLAVRPRSSPVRTYYPLPVHLAGSQSAPTPFRCRYNQPEEDILTALHVPLFERELASLRLEAKAATAENPDRDASRTMLHAQIKILEQYFSVHAASNAAFHTRAWGTVAVGGAGRASAEVARDLSKFYPGAITTIAIDHRKTGADTMEKDGHLKSAFANFVKELSKDHGHLPKFADPTVAAHYAALYAVLAEKRVDKRTLDNLARILQANSLNVDGTALKDDEGKGKSAFTASTHFLLALGDRGSGDVLFAAPHCHATYAPNTMEEVMLVHFAAILK